MLRNALLVVFVVFVVASPVAAQTHQVKLNGHTFTLPEGFTIELAAGADRVPRPIAAAFDEKGRLYVTDSAGTNANVKEQLKDKPHRIVRLESTKGDGTFDKQTVFVKNVMFPEGCMWLNGSLYVAAPPHIWKFTDTNDDGVADKEEIWFDGKTLTGCANDLHGPYRGPDGWIYWTKGAFAKQEYTVNGKKFTTRAAHIFRARPDGTGIEPVMTGGMDNPVDVVFTPGGDLIFTTTFFQHPANGRRDGLVHAIYGAVYGKDHDPVYEHPWTHPTLMPPMTHLGPAAPAGLHRYESDQFGKDYANNLFACQFNMRKVSRHILIPKGSTYETRDSDFVVSDNLDFHPTDVIEDADGSLLIVDTGGWYKLCCPTSQLVKPDVTGAIYRVKKTGAHTVDDPRGLRITWDTPNAIRFAELLDDPRPVVRLKAIDALALNTRENRRALRGAFLRGSELAQLNAVWAAGRIKDRDAIIDLMDTRNWQTIPEEVPIAVAHMCGMTRDETTHRMFLHWIKLLDVTNKPHLRRALTEALGRFGDPTDVSGILTALADEQNDRTLDHALTYALIEIGDVQQTAAALNHQSPRVRRAVLAALENIPGANLHVAMVVAELDSMDAALSDTAWWIAGKHPQWGDHLAIYFKAKLKTADRLKPEGREELAARLVKFAKSEAIQTVLGEALDGSEPAEARFILGAMARSGLRSLPAAWKVGIGSKIGSKDSDVMNAAFAVLRAVPASEPDYVDIVAVGRLALAAQQRKWSGEELLALLAAAPPNTTQLTHDELALALKMLDRNQSAPSRAQAADTLSRVKLSTHQVAEVAAGLKAINPLDLPKLLAVFEKSKDEPVGLALVKALREKELFSTIRAEMVKPILDKYPQAVKDEAEKLYAELAEARKDERAKLERLLAELKPGDIRRGQLVFNNAKAQCIACHKMGYVGGSVGPDLTKIGSIRTERDLLESIVFPSASFVRSYEPVRVVTTDERTLNGILKKDAPDEIILIVAVDKDERIARADVASITPSSVSLMPSGLDQQLTAQDLADLIAFLKASR